ncbi:HPr family phosphocarrier protein [Sulfuriflexus mobilis]|uniref:HPr family phosphocarrier protein n=1 Tax=Sulfuriflexus mobilis TaxID=1811807 RepID=UPI000F8225E1|nr:HPr family phosphocarrier protein [Sulfuriflexus mobilis]
MTEANVTIINKLGLHARAAAKFVTLASGFDSKIELTRNGKTVNGKSIMGVMMLAASKGTDLTVRAIGSDEDEAIAKISELITDRFGEDE